MILDASNLIVGRLASIVAKKLLLGEIIDIVNCDKAVVSGKKEFLILDYKRKRDMGTFVKGPFYFRSSERYVKRVIRGMVDYKKDRGRKALKRIKCYSDVPEKLKDKKFETLKEADVLKIKNLNYMQVRKLLDFVCKK